MKIPMKKITAIIVLSAITTTSFAGVFSKDSPTIQQDKEEIKAIKFKIQEDEKQIKEAKKRVKKNSSFFDDAHNEREKLRLQKEVLEKDNLKLKEAKQKLKEDKILKK